MSTPTIPLASKSVQLAVAQSTKPDNNTFAQSTDLRTRTQHRINRNHQEHLDALGLGLGNLLAYLDSLIRSGTIAPPIPPTPTLATILNVTLVAATTTTINPIPPTIEGLFLIVFVKSAGPTALLAWDPSMLFAQLGFDSTVDLWSTFPFVARIDPTDSILKWTQYSIQLTGQS